MRVTAETHRSHGAAILQAASQLFRARGVAAVSVGEVSAAAGLTHGAFYGHFPSKAALAEAACRDVMAASVRRFRARAEAGRAEGDTGLAAIIGYYLTEQHRDNPQDGCIVAALGAELARAEPGLRAAFAEGTATLLAVIEEEIGRLRPDALAEARRAAAAGVFAALAGGLILARAITDPDASRASLAAARRAALAAAQI